MNENDISSHSGLPSNWAGDELDYLRWRLQQLGSWPESADQLLEELAVMDQQTGPMTEEDEEMLSLMIDEALKGVDIASRHPTFFRKLLASADLRHAFLDALDLLEKSRAGTLVPLPEVTSGNLDFLKRGLPQVQVGKSESGSWRVQWRQTAAHIQQLLSRWDLTGSAAYRFDDSSLEDDWFTLLRSQAEVTGAEIMVVLEASQSVSDPSSLTIAALVSFTDEASEAGGSPSLQFHLRWGSYQGTALADQRGRAIFPSLPLASILDKQGQLVQSDLELSLEPVSTDR